MAIAIFIKAPSALHAPDEIRMHPIRVPRELHRDYSHSHGERLDMEKQWDTNRERFEKSLRAYDAHQSLTLADDYPCYASRVTKMAAHIFESRQPEINSLRNELSQYRTLIEMYKTAVGMREIEIDALKEELERLRKPLRGEEPP